MGEYCHYSPKQHSKYRKNTVKFSKTGNITSSSYTSQQSLHQQRCNEGQTTLGSVIRLNELGTCSSEGSPWGWHSWAAVISKQSHCCPRVPATEGDYSALRGGSTNNDEYHGTENIFGTNKQLHSASVIPEMGGERDTNKDSPMGNLDTL